LENAGSRGWQGKNIGCYVGNYGGDWLDMDNKDTQDRPLYRMLGYDDPMLANRISYEFDFKGPRYVKQQVV
jgi:acyl transferase domain-containing protein